MNDLLKLLKGGDLRSDGAAEEVSEDIIQNTELFDLLFEGLYEKDEVVRGRTAHALEKVSRAHPELFKGQIYELIKIARNDDIPFVKWHLAMIFANIDLSVDERKDVISTLFYLLDDKSVFVKSWSISSLTIIALENPDEKEVIIFRLNKLADNKSAAVQKRAIKALKTLNEDYPLPKGWSKIKRKI